MRSSIKTATGGVATSTELGAALLGLLLLPGAGIVAGSIYKYQGEDGRWVFTDRQPGQQQTFETEALAGVAAQEPEVRVRVLERGDSLEFVADNSCHCPVEVVLQFGTGQPLRPDGMRVVAGVPARASALLTRFDRTDAPAAMDYEFGFVLGDPASRHAPRRPYRGPFGAAKQYRVTQAYPDAYTHDTPASRYAVDIAMPEQSAVHAARGGVVVAVAHSNFRGGRDRDKYGADANIVQIMHDDGSFGLYAHLSWDSIRVRPGQRVQRGEYIANSGSTGFTTGPHLHFAVLSNHGLEIRSEQIAFDDGQGAALIVATGDLLKNP